MPACNACKKEILAPSAVATYESKTFHPDCLLCSKCNLSLNGKQFLKEKSGDLVCEDCNIKHSPKCTKCGNIFGPGKTYKKLTDNIFYHNECFKCCGPCKKPIMAEFYDMENGNFLCTDCYDKYGTDFDVDPSEIDAKDEVSSLASKINATKIDNEKPKVEVLPAIERQPPKAKEADPICFKCGKKLEGSYTTYNDQKYHSKCFTCTQCNEEFKEKSFFKKDGKPLCRECHNKNLVNAANKCRKCTQPILDTVVTYKNAEYHDYCLTCTSCSNKLVGQSIYADKNENPYCVDCYTKKEAKTCAKCALKISPAQTSLIFDGKNFHKECFVCVKCTRPVGPEETFYKSDDGNGILCVTCAEQD